MRVITITFRENPERKEVETFFSCEPSGDSTSLENLMVFHKAPVLIEALKVGCMAIVAGNESEEDLRQKARVSVDIQRSGQ